MLVRVRFNRSRQSHVPCRPLCVLISSLVVANRYVRQSSCSPFFFRSQEVSAYLISFSFSTKSLVLGSNAGSGLPWMEEGGSFSLQLSTNQMQRGYYQHTQAGSTGSEELIAGKVVIVKTKLIASVVVVVANVCLHLAELFFIRSQKKRPNTIPPAPLSSSVHHYSSLFEHARRQGSNDGCRIHMAI